MPGNRPSLYWDADVFISYADENQAGRWPVLDAILGRSANQRGSHQIVTSVLSITEVAYVASELSGGLDPGVETKLDGFWQPNGAIQVCELHPAIARGARDLIRLGVQQQIKRLRPLDAIHLATAMAMQVEEFRTYNVADFAPYTSIVSFTIAEPHTEQPMLFNLGGV